MIRKKKFEKVEDLMNKIDTLIPHQQRNTESKSCSVVYVKKQKHHWLHSSHSNQTILKGGGGGDFMIHEP